ncbi:hypothetical protein LB524_17925 [Mesorhizobium sp. ESP6-5]|uniref:hypothetical protein n=1 Tax=unclassified Mesorhizobium TaxID=325217 RepID=UPI001126A2A2|nr:MULTISPECIES: hypothetical protein [unclassified Mesorhizobium]MBZ9757167.1 hypothetical protein [Mesorhizobium sp. ESP6-5]TPK74265.1 hypothetical protein FJ527_19465 [Mesorhizobium sp. B2-4-18]TPM00539.1 hypothetical protein FJ943_10115 [Mesorhizobium sp. B2-3-10]
MKLFRTVFGAALLVACLDHAAMATTQNVIFNGTVTATCTLVVGTNGTMTVSADLQSLSSHNSGGSAGTVTLTTTGGVSLSVDPVTLTTVPAADSTATTWTPTYSASGAHTTAETGAATALAVPGADLVSVHLAGTKGGSNRFATGNYQATVTLRCE